MSSPISWSASYYLLKRLSPLEAYRSIAETFVDGPVRALVQFGLEAIPEGTPPEQLTLETRVEGPLPFYLTDWFAALTLAAWAIVPAMLGSLRFERSDL